MEAPTQLGHFSFPLYLKNITSKSLNMTEILVALSLKKKKKYVVVRTEENHGRDFFFFFFFFS